MFWRMIARDILLVVEGSKDALAALHFADAEEKLSSVGVVAALSASVNLLAEDVEKFYGRRSEFSEMRTQPANTQPIASGGSSRL
jgi:hypothetical protein